ncbi:T6SS immunity protein Tli4 family protein [Achromobacter seleniivolatilans]|uniref:T6SS immunity protein Tli4 family protein n=1 Tax=Achromobacter seleniivolatilans TaxID=3047478 RepID=A0ABY9LVH1_9BURK|nr:T6SS immunity protein Tli4 family protein [Achromobacter sp. R39]WMD18791.1 T6SS immunity protein Tli4 family protein [Achromobacter sp. R39]
MNRKYLIHILLTACLIAATAVGIDQWRLAHPQRVHAMTTLTENMRTHCIGRLQIDLPDGTTTPANASGAIVRGLDVSVTTGVSRQRYEEILEARWQALQGLTHDNYGKQYIRPSEKIGSNELGFIFAYQYKSLHVPDLYGVWANRIFHNAEGYVWLDGALVKIRSDVDGKDLISQLLPAISARSPEQFPTQAGLCLDGIFIAEPYNMERDESVTWKFNLPRNMTAVIRHTKVWGPARSITKRASASAAFRAAYLASRSSDQVFKEHMFRIANRTVGELVGEEVVVGSLEGASDAPYQTQIGGTWEFPGRGADSPAPQIVVDLSVFGIETNDMPSPAGGFPKIEDMPNGPTEEEFFEVWDAMVASTRIRSGALTPPRPVESPPSPVSSAQAEANQKLMDDFLSTDEHGMLWKPVDD